MMSVSVSAPQEDEREVLPEEGATFARENDCLYREASAKTDVGVYDAIIWGCGKC